MRELPPVPNGTPETLTTILGLGEQVTSAELRQAYESAMAAAAGTGGVTQALRLLRAYEALPEGRRHLVYGTISVDGPPPPAVKLTEAAAGSRRPAPFVDRARAATFRTWPTDSAAPTPGRRCTPRCAPA